MEEKLKELSERDLVHMLDCLNSKDDVVTFVGVRYPFSGNRTDVERVQEKINKLGEPIKSYKLKKNCSFSKLDKKFLEHMLIVHTVDDERVDIFRLAIIKDKLSAVGFPTGLSKKQCILWIRFE